MSNARAVFDRFISGGLAEVEGTIQSPAQEENLYLDFKQAAKGQGPMETDDRKNLAEALSGFANSDGGVIVWGVKCTSISKDDPDTATELKPISNLLLFLGDLQKGTAELVSPGIVGVEHQAIENAPGSDKGYIVSYVPKSNIPQMARGKDQHRFYFRSGSSFLKMEPFMLADRYSRRPHPNLSIKCNAASQRKSEQESASVTLTFGIYNQGLGIAIHPALEIKQNPWFVHSKYGLDGNGYHGLGQLSIPGQDSLFAGGADIVVYPNQTLWVAKFKAENFTLEQMVFRPVNPEIHYSLLCDGFSCKGAITLNLEGLIMATHYGQEVDALQRSVGKHEIISSSEW